MAVQASKVSRDGMLANIHFFRVRDYTEQASMVLLNTPCYVLIHDMLPAPVMENVGMLLLFVATCTALQFQHLSAGCLAPWLTV